MRKKRIDTHDVDAKADLKKIDTSARANPKKIDTSARANPEKIVTQSCLDKLQVSWVKCIADVNARGITIVAKNNYECANPTVKLLISLDNQIRRLVKDLNPDDIQARELADVFKLIEGL